MNNQETSAKVRNFYDFFPFPGRLVETFNLPNGARMNFKLFLARNTLFGAANLKRIRRMYEGIFKDPRKIFEAACGTGELACLTALAFSEAKVQACDLSRTNLDYAEKLKDFLGINNLRLFQYDLTSEHLLDSRDNDLVICSGAIHHLSNPVKGLYNLARIIQPQGRVFFGVYGKSFFREQYTSVR